MSTRNKTATPPAKLAPKPQQTSSNDISYKMCKKIAQLTKVVYFLNTKNEDHSTELKSLVEAYEAEIANLTAEATEKIQEFASKCEEKEIEIAAHEKIIQNNVDQIYDLEKNLGDTKAKLSDAIKRATILEVEVGKKVAVVEQLERSTSDLADKINSTKSISESELRAREEDLKRATEEFQRQLNEQRESYEAKINKINVKHAKELQVLSDEKSQLSDTLRDTVASMKKRHDDDAKYFQHESKRLKQTILELEKNYQESSKEIEKKYSVALEKEEKKNLTLQGQIHALDADILRKNEEIEISKRSTVEKINECNNLTKTLGQQSEKIMQLEKNLMDKSATLLNTEMKLEQLQIKYDAQIESFNALEEECIQVKLDWTSVSSEYTELKAEHQDVLRTNFNLIAEIRELTVQKEDLLSTKEKLEKSIANLQRDKREMKEAHAIVFLNLLQELSEKLQKLETDLRAEHAEALHTALDNLTMQYEAKLSEKKTELASAFTVVKNLRADKEAMLHAMRNEYDTMKTDLDTKISALTVENSLIKERNATLKASVEEHLIEISKLKMNMEMIRAQNEQMELDRSHLYQKMVNIEEQLRHEMDSKFKMDLQLLKEKCKREEEVAVAEAKIEMREMFDQELAKIINNLQQEKEQALHELRTTQAEAMEKLGNEKTFIDDAFKQLDFNFTQLVQENMELQEKHKLELAELRKSDMQEAAEERKKLETSLQSQITQMRVQNAIALNNVEKKHKQTIEDLGVAHDKHIVEVRAEMEKIAAQAKRVYDIEKTIEIEKLNLEKSYELQQQHEKHLQELAKREADVSDKFQKILLQASERSAAESLVKDTEIADLRNQVAELSNDKERIITELKEVQIKIADMKMDLAGKDIELDLLKKSSKEALKKLEETWVERHEKEIEDVNLLHLEDSQKMLVDFDQGQKFLKNEISSLQKKIKEAEIKYINRESREDDIQKINALEEQFKRVKARNDTLKEEVNLYRLELSNREANFNKIFNKNPNVGLLQTKRKSFSNVDSPLNTRLPPLVSQLAEKPQAV